MGGWSGSWEEEQQEVALRGVVFMLAVSEHFSSHYFRYCVSGVLICCKFDESDLTLDSNTGLKNTFHGFCFILAKPIS